MPAFYQKVYRLLKKVPAGKVTTYKALAHTLGIRAYQAIGQAMRNNPYAPRIPCHRVIKSDGTLGGFMGKTRGPAIEKKKKMLEKEGIKFAGDKVQNFPKTLHKFNNNT